MALIHRVKPVSLVPMVAHNVTAQATVLKIVTKIQTSPLASHNAYRAKFSMETLAGPVLARKVTF